MSFKTLKFILVLVALFSVCFSVYGYSLSAEDAESLELSFELPLSYFSENDFLIQSVSDEEAEDSFVEPTNVADTLHYTVVEESLPSLLDNTQLLSAGEEEVSSTEEALPLDNESPALTASSSEMSSGSPDSMVATETVSAESTLPVSQQAATGAAATTSITNNELTTTSSGSFLASSHANELPISLVAGNLHGLLSSSSPVIVQKTSSLITDQNKCKEYEYTYPCGLLSFLPFDICKPVKVCTKFLGQHNNPMLLRR